MCVMRVKLFEEAALYNGDAKVNCEDKHDNLIDGKMTFSDINVTCRSIFDGIEKQLLVQFFRRDVVQTMESF